MKKKAEEIKVGDLVRCRISAEQPFARVKAIRTYEGPFSNIGCFALADVEYGNGFSLWRGQEWEVA